MGDKEGREWRLFAEAEKVFVEPVARQFIECGEGLIEQQQTRPAGQRARGTPAFSCHRTIAAGYCAPLICTDEAEKFLRLRVSRCFRHALQTQGQFNIPKGLPVQAARLVPER